MKLVDISINNYRQFDEAKLSFEDGITILAGANNSGKTSIITLIKNVFNDDKSNYCESDIPAKNMRNWISEVYPRFETFFTKDCSIEKIEEDLVECILPNDKDKHQRCMDTTKLKIHVSYDPNNDDIKLFADYIMDLDEEKHDFYFEYCYEIKRTKFIKAIFKEFEKVKKRFEEIRDDKINLTDPADEEGKHNIELKERYLKQKIVTLYVNSIVPTCYFCDEKYENRCQMDDVKQFRKLFNFCFIKASRPLDDDSSDHSHSISKQIIKMAKLDGEWNELIDELPDEILKPIQDKDISNKVQKTSLNSLKETITAIEQTNGGRSGELMLDMLVTEEDISELLQRITTATYCVDGYFLGEESQGLGYSNMIYIHLQLNEYENSKDDCKVNVFFVEEPESHMHPQMQQVFIKYLIDHYKEGIQGLITTHSNEMVRVAGLTHLRVIRKKDDSFLSELYDLSKLIRSLEESSDQDDKKLAEFYDWFFEIGYSELIFADKAIFYEGDTERLYIRKLLTTLEKYKKLKQQYIAYIQVGGAYAKNYKKMIKLLGIKSLIITDIDYYKDKETVREINDSEITNATIKEFYRIDNPESAPTVKNLYDWKASNKNVISNGLIYTCFQTKDDGYARTLEEVMLAKYFSIDVTMSFTKNEWSDKRKESRLKFVIPTKGIKEDDLIKLRGILESTSNSKTDFMYSVVLNKKVEDTEPNYIQGGLEWLMK
ncbi:AAA family ATPase [Streptococcus infantarius]|uniref:AAA family ATPase n=1 Tax=Streptococcus infantarius TaxID=102684 RepID=UPI0022E7F586|nr:AAA family ATPase [Streptococcus infantarius]